MTNYEKILKFKVFNLGDIYNLTGNINSAKSIIRSMLSKNYIKRIKHNLYAVCDIEFKNTIPDQYMIASKIKDDSYISYHSALEYYGVKNQFFYEVYVSTSKRFESFEFDGFLYKFINSKYDFGVIENDKVRVTDKERTLINEELIMCLELLGKLDEEKILKYLKEYNSKKLYSKVGFFLKLFQKNYGISNSSINTCKRNSEKKKLYFNEETKKMKSKYVKEWNLIIPEIFLNKGEGLFW